MPFGGLILGFVAGGVAVFFVQNAARQRAMDTTRAQFAAILAQPGLGADRDRVLAARDAILAELHPVAIVAGPQREREST